ncbi:alanine--glyoxylate aminotransferase family protein [Flammeovirga sp. MY04]|uniref:aminotransferase class V-fold PLP-dependent enzyme n=1 Tax=Flammeovirga sp. MY04 TaxID=1191459 RepID=UPI0008268D10|nr:aminotransferase class V-fold PLP-dependent enzyme [Flammeovirga sp. MY04]ANQ49454.2 alanine--glyoxylate aminotransferase family protein [Flammeovirga sp. MY04]
MISFYPGPSKIENNIDKYMQDAFEEGILSCNHRSDEFMQLMQSTIATVKDKLEIPKNYEVFFTSSATECWEITDQSFREKKFIHIYNGAFGEKWANYNTNKKVEKYKYPIHRSISLHHLDALEAKSADVLCLTSCETSNTTFIHSKTLQKIRKRYPKPLIFIDATSSMSGINMDWLSADLWYASVQKCFGLPSGLAIMVCSPKALSNLNQEDKHYNNLYSIYKNQQKHQTTHTPNILGIYLLNKVLQQRPNIRKVENELKNRMERLIKLMQKLGYDFIVPTTRLRSPTVLGIKSSEEKVHLIKQKAKKNGITLGNGYGTWKHNTFRIANFPAHTEKDFKNLHDFFRKIEKM